MGRLSSSERELGRHSRDATKRKKDQVGQALQERFATGNERDLRKSFSGSRASARAITPALSSTDTQIALLKGSQRIRWIFVLSVENEWR